MSDPKTVTQSDANGEPETQGPICLWKNASIPHARHGWKWGPVERLCTGVQVKQETWSCSAFHEPDCQCAARIQELVSEIARLQHGEDDTPREPGAWPTPGQWIHRWNRLLPERRLWMAARMIEWQQQASACRELDHAGRIQELEARVVTLTEQLTDHRAALKRAHAEEG
jgi:hypothetical protein